MVDPENPDKQIPVPVAVTKDWKSRLVDMAFNQGPAFVVMAITMIYVANQIPVHIKTIQTGYKEVIADAKAERIQQEDRSKAERVEQAVRNAETIKNILEESKAEKDWFRQWIQNRNQGSALRTSPESLP